MDKHRNDTLTINFHNPNTKEVTLLALVHLSAEIASLRAKEQLLHIS